MRANRSPSTTILNQGCSMCCRALVKSETARIATHTAMIVRNRPRRLTEGCNDVLIRCSPTSRPKPTYHACAVGTTRDWSWSWRHSESASTSEHAEWTGHERVALARNSCGQVRATGHSEVGSAGGEPLGWQKRS